MLSFVNSRQSEDDHRRQPRAAEEARDDARRHGDVLLALQFVADHAAADAAAGVETVEHLAVARVEREKVVVHVAGEEHATLRRDYACDEWSLPGAFPARLASRGIERGQPPLRLVAWVADDGAAVVVRFAGELGFLVELRERPAPVDCGDKQRVALRAVGGTVPLHAAEQARAAVDALHRGWRIDVLARRDRHLVQDFVSVAVEHAQQPVLAAQGHEFARLAIHLGAEKRAYLAYRCRAGRARRPGGTTAACRSSRPEQP